MMADIAALERDIRNWDSINDHRTGTEGDSRTSEWLADEILAAGFEPSIDAFVFPRWVLNDCSIEAEGTRLEGVPLFDGGTTAASGIEAPLHDLAANDGIGVGPLSPATLGNFDEVRRSDRVGVVAIAAMDASVPGLALQNAPRFVDPFGPPVLQIATEHGTWMEEAVAARSNAKLTVAVERRTSIASNVQARIPGRDRDLPPLVVMTPKSAWWTCTAERSGGIAIWLAALRHFADNQPGRDVIFTANTGHELGHTGLEHFLSRDRALGAGAHAWFHLGANFITEGGSFRLQVSDHEMESIADQALTAAGETPAFRLGPGKQPGGEAHNIYDLNGRYISFIGSNPYFHHPDDRWPTTIDLDKAARLTDAGLGIASALAR